jgi:hypothetical protein
VLPVKRSRLALVAVAGLAGAVAFAADDPVPKPTAEIVDVMFTMNDDGNEGAVLQQLKAMCKAGLDDDGWRVAGAKAAMMVEGGNLLLGKKPPRGADDAAGLSAWKTRAGAYRDGALGIRDAVAKKDAAAATAAIRVVEKQCTECHRAHQPEE